MAKERNAVARLEADDSRLRKALVRSKKELVDFGKEVASKLKNIDRGAVADKLKGAFGRASGISGVGAGLGFDELSRESIDFERTLTRVAIKTNATAAEMDSWRTLLNKVAEETPQARQGLGLLLAEFEDLNVDMKTATESTAAVAKLVTVTGASFQDAAKLVAVFSKSLGLAGTEMEVAFSSMLAQGVADVPAFAAMIEALGPQLQKAGFQGVEGIRQMGAIISVLGDDFTDDAQAGAALAKVLDKLTTRASEFRKRGIRTLDKKGKLRDVGEIFADIGKKGMTEEQLSKIFGKDPDMRRIVKRLSEAGDEVAAMTAEGADTRRLGEAFERYVTAPAGRMEAAANRAKQKLLELFTPERIESFAFAMDKVSGAIAFMADHAREVVIAFGGLKVGGGIAGAFSGATSAMGGFVGKLGAAAGALGVLTSALLLAIDAVEKEQEKDIETKTEQAREVDAITKGRTKQTEEIARKKGLIDPKTGEVRKDRVRKVLEDSGRAGRRLGRFEGGASMAKGVANALTDVQVEIMADRIAAAHERVLSKTFGPRQAPSVTVEVDGESTRAARVR